MKRHRMTIALTPAELSRSWLVEHYRRQTRAPIRAAAEDASMPAWPAPMTRTSNFKNHPLIVVFGL